MNVSFFIEDNKYKGNITRNQILEVVKPVTQCEFNEDYEYLYMYLSKKMNENQSCFLGQKGISARGFYFSFDNEKNRYCVKVPMPCSFDDFQVVLDFIKKLCVFLETDKVVTDSGEEYTTAEKDNFQAVFDFINTIASALGKNEAVVKNSEENTTANIKHYPFRKQIISSLREMLENLKSKTNGDTIELSGINRVVAFNEKILNEIINADDVVRAFSEFITNIQYLDAYSANQKLYRGKYIAIYTLKENEITVLPFKPKVDPQALSRGIKKEDVCNFALDIIGIDGNINDESSHHKLGSLKYSDFIEKLPKDKYKFIDANHILIEALSRKDLENLLAQ